MENKEDKMATIEEVVDLWDEKYPERGRIVIRSESRARYGGRIMCTENHDTQHERAVIKLSDHFDYKKPPQVYYVFEYSRTGFKVKFERRDGTKELLDTTTNLITLLKKFKDKKVCGKQLSLEENTDYDRGNKNSVSLTIKFQNSSAEDICKGMEELIEMTREPLRKFLNDPTLTQGDNMKLSDQLVEQLRNSKNLILTGAPGTGKTYLAQQIAMQMIGVKTGQELKASEQFGFVQFHPSYDYTDFVEGLRPTKPDEDGKIGFELQKGIFKEFCGKASRIKSSNFDEIYKEFIDKIIETPLKLDTPVHKKTFSIRISPSKNCIAVPETEKATPMTIRKDMIRDYVENGSIGDFPSYTIAIGNHIKDYYKIETKDISNTKKSFVFIIDEINRGEISKIFGELFFSIDTGYRGEKGKIKTQYQNMIEVGDSFYDGFYIPENVFIIGTMNDIDRSVESFDFAMRRRFVWREITAKESAMNMNLPQMTINRMDSLNDAISKMDGLNSSYHIGGAYFLDENGKPIDLENENNRNELWKLRLKPLLFEYLRGMQDAKGKLETMEKAYNLINNTNEADSE